MISTHKRSIAILFLRTSAAALSISPASAAGGHEAADPFQLEAPVITVEYDLDNDILSLNANHWKSGDVIGQNHITVDFDAGLLCAHFKASGPMCESFAPSLEGDAVDGTSPFHRRLQDAACTLAAEKQAAEFIRKFCRSNTAPFVGS